MSNSQPEETELEHDELLQAEGENASVDLAFLDLDANGTVDLDALFDALNIAASEGNAAFDFIQNSTDRGGRLIVSEADLALGGSAEDVSPVGGMFFNNSLLSDES